MTYQAITTKFLGPTDYRGSRIKASAWDGSVTVPYDHAKSTIGAHRVAAEALVKKLGWSGRWFSGGLPTGGGYVFINMSNAGEPDFEVAA